MGAICCVQRHFGGVSLGLVSVGVQAVKVSILLTEKIYFSYFIEMQMIDDFLLNRRYVNMYALNVLSSFNYVEISMML
jgi:hypothetical protein